MKTVKISTRSDFALGAIERAREIVTSEGAAFAMAAREMDEEALGKTQPRSARRSAMLMLKVFDVLTVD
ncbi:hypothetical protein J2X76_005075 [Neorhizobium sp. 2083]|uniref:hypothetical protein n=1 Tax=Neorhizobium sp. 2083 TaxID=2817762 RepID=UPI002855A72A|nr:hypothetical protein [Neorhizobium sp. 2083]MDR6819878.1 hypothetical protein [Neorhizobium sp. 2083]